MKFKKWAPLEEGDVIDIVAPGMSPGSGVLKNVAPFLKTWDLQARIPKNLLGKDLICSNSKKIRFNTLKKALHAKDSKMVWCLRGGYGSLHLVEDLKKIKAPSPKIFMGLSDICTLHTFLNQEWGWATIHGSHLGRLASGDAKKPEIRRFQKILFGEHTEVSYSIKPLNSRAKKAGVLNGAVVGGNLITLQSSFGTRYQLKTKNRILFFEDIGERAYRIDRVFEHMKQLGMFTGVRAVVFGQFTGGREPNGKNLVPKLLQQFASEQKLPVFSGVSAGHGPNQHPVPFNTSARIQCGARPKITIQSGAQ